jgi:RHS repeat-associated protein
MAAGRGGCEFLDLSADRTVTGAGSVNDMPKLPTISLPAGGGEQKGMGESFSPDAFTGVNALSFPVRVTSVRSIAPQLTLDYSAGGANGAYGLGFDIAMPHISVRTEKSIPRYDDRDQYVADGGQVLVPRLTPTPDGWIPQSTTQTGEDGAAYTVAAYRARVETTYTRFERWQRQSDGDIHWRAVTTADETYIFGTGADARIYDPADVSHVYSWLCERVVSATGDERLYTYVADDSQNLPNLPSNQDRSNVAQKYPAEIRYGAYEDGGQTKYAVRVVFDYGQYDIAPSNPNPYEPVRTWPARPDPFSTYRPGFEIRTNRLCCGVMVFHALPELGPDPCLVGVTQLVYATPNGLSQLSTLSYIGYSHGTDGSTETLSTPSFSFGYQPFAPQAQRFVPLDIRDSAPAGTVGAPDFQLVDLYGDGLPGLLTSSESEFLYWRNEGAGRFGPPQPPAFFPNNRDLTAAGTLALVDLDGSGRPDLMVSAPAGAGYYGNEGADAWSSFRTFAAGATEAFTPDAQFVDLEGSGRAELVVMSQGMLRYYPGLGTQGFGPPVNLIPPEQLPDPSALQESTVVRFADMFGDGGSHLVRVASGEVLCWPSLGHGRFAPAVMFDNAPVFPGPFEAGRILIGDFSGSGPADIVYIGADALYLYVNACGDGFADPVIVPLPATFGPLSEATDGDVYGNGGRCVVVSGLEQRPAALDFTGGVTPSLLAAADNGMGATSAFRYASSTVFMLADRARGTPWPQAVPSPMQVLVEIAATDPFRATVLRTRMAYHDGYFDREESQFRGFGYVQSWVDETLDGAAVTPAVYTRNWFQTGAYKDQDAFYARYLSEFYAGDLEALVLPPSEAEMLSDPPDPQALVQAQTALAGKNIRTETYGLDGAAEQDVPYTVSENNYTMRELQPGSADNYAVFQIQPRETIDYAYDRVADDPRVTQSFSLEVNDYNQVTLAANVAYPRRAGHDAYPEQLVLGAGATTQVFAQNIGDGYLPLEVAEEQKFTLGNLSRGSGLYFSFDEIAAQTGTALENVIPPETPFSGSTPQARLRGWSRNYYWNAGQTAPLDLYEVVSPALQRNGESIVFSAGMAEAAYDGKLTGAEIAADGYYFEDSGYWWNPGAVMSYAGATQFYLPLSTEAQNGAVSGVTYDAYSIAVLTAYDPDGTSTSVPDYQSFAPVQLTDVNGTVSQILTDALGRPLVSTSFRFNASGEREGDDDVSSYVPVVGATLSSVLADPGAYLQGMTSYSFHSFAPSPGQPPVELTVARQFHVSDLPPGTQSPMRLTIGYFDGAGEALESKQQVEAEAAGAESAVWLVTDKTLKGAQGQVLRTYLPAFETVPEFTFYASGLYDTATYDALLRQVELLTAKGFVSRNAYGSWSTVGWDFDDAVKTSPYYQGHIDDTDPAFANQRDALIKAAVFENTPTTQVLDPLGRIYRIEQIDLSSLDPAPVTMTTLSVLNAEGLTVRIAGPRFTQDGGTPTVWNTTTGYDLGGTVMVIASVDSGTRTTFTDALGSIVHQWDARGTHLERQYDAMNRPTAVLLVTEDAAPAVLEAYTYGSDAASNTIGRLIERRDQSGITTYSQFDLAGSPEQESFALCVSYKGEVDWSPGNEVPVEAPLTASRLNDAFGQLSAETRPDGSALAYSYYMPGWVRGTELTLKDGTAQTVVSAVRYNAFASPTKARYGTGIDTLRTYEDTTGNLTAILAERAGDGTALQDISYAYDPMGNVTSAEDRTIPLVFCNQTQVSPLLDYTYSAIYWLLNAKGRENPGITASTYLTGFKQSVYMPLCPTDPNDDVKLIPYQETYTYDLSGNLQTIVHATSETALSWTRTMTTAANSDRTVLAGGISPEASFDADGNLIDLGSGRPLGWDAFNRLASASLLQRDDGPDDAEYYVYDGTGERRRKVMTRLTAGGLEVKDVVYFAGVQLYRDVPEDGAAPVVEREGLLLGEGDARVLMVYQWPGGANPTQLRYQLATALDCVSLEVDASGAVISYEEYFPYGGTAIIAGDAKAGVKLKYYRFTGKECDDGTGLYYFGARYYASWLGRWISCDPSGPKDSLNLYQYVTCNPVSATDPTGNGKDDLIKIPKAAVDEFKKAYRYLTAAETAHYEALAKAIETHIETHPQVTSTSSTERFPPTIEQSILDMFDAHKSLHLGKNPSLGALWIKALARKAQGTDMIKNYTGTRSHMTGELKDSPFIEHIEDPQFHRTIELHHGVKKQFFPQYATTPHNLWAVSRGGSSYGVVGQHEGAFHLVGAGGQGNRYTTEVAAYSMLMMHWEGLKTMTGRRPGEVIPPSLSATLVSVVPLPGTAPIVVTTHVAITPANDDDADDDDDEIPTGSVKRTRTSARIAANDRNSKRRKKT